MTRPRTIRPHQIDPELAKLEPRERLILCARDLFQQKSFDGVNIREIMAAADVTQPTIYYYFQHKDGLFLASALDLLQEIDEDFNQALREPDFPSQLKALARAFAAPPAPNLALLYRDLNQRIQLNSQYPNQGITTLEARPALLYVNQIWPRALENLLRETRQAGQIQTSNSTFLAHYILTLLTAYPHSPFKANIYNNPDQALETLLDFVYSNLRLANVSVQI
jgi:AcrR family transcriptional regulator